MSSAPSRPGYAGSASAATPGPEGLAALLIGQGRSDPFDVPADEQRKMPSSNTTGDGASSIACEKLVQGRSESYVVPTRLWVTWVIGFDGVGWHGQPGCFLSASFVGLS